MDRKWWYNSYIVEIKVKDIIKDLRWHFINERCNSLYPRWRTWEMLKDGLHPRDRITIPIVNIYWFVHIRPQWIQDTMSFILVIGGALTPRQGYEQCEDGHRPPLFVKTFYILIFIYFCNNYSYIIYSFMNIYIIK